MSKPRTRKPQSVTPVETKSGPMVPNMDPLFNAPPRFWAMKGGASYAGPLVYRATDIIASYTKSAKSVWVTPTDDTDFIELRDNDPVHKLFDAPNSLMSWGEMRYACETYRLLQGGWIALCIGMDGRPTNGFPISILLFPISGWVRTAQGQRITNDGEYYRTDGWRNDQLQVQVQDDECVAMLNFDPSLRFRPASAAGFAALPAQVQQMVLLYQQALLSNDNRPGMVISADKTVKEDNRSRLEAEMMSNYGGVINAGRTMFLSGDKMDWKVTPIDSLKLTEIASREYSRDLEQQVGVAFGIPELILIGSAEHANKESSRSIESGFLVRTIEPAMLSFDDIWNRKFFRRLDLPVRMHLDPWSLSAFRAVALDRMDLVKARLETGDTPEAAYKFSGIPYTANKQSQKPTLASTILQVQDEPKPQPIPPALAGFAGKPVDALAAPKVPDVVEKPNTDAGESSHEQESAQAKPVAKKSYINVLEQTRIAVKRIQSQASQKRRALADSIWAKCVTPHEPSMVKVTQKCVRHQQGEVLKKLTYFMNTGRHLTKDSRELLDRSIWIELATKAAPKIPGVGDLDSFLPDDDKSNAELRMSWRALFDDVRKSTETQVESELGDISGWIGTAPEEHRNIALDRLGDVVDVNETTRKQLKATMERTLGDYAGATPIQIAEALRAEVKTVFDHAITRANTVARTELGNVMGDYRSAIMAANGVEKVRWISAHDNHVRESHQKCDAQGAIPMGQKFSNGLRRPHDPEGEASEVINCRCVLVAA